MNGTLAIILGASLLWTIVGWLIYMANAHNVRRPIKKFVFSAVCGPIGWLCGIIDWCTTNN